MEQVFDVAAQQVLGCPAFHAQKVMMVAPMAELIVEVAFLEKHPAQNPRIHQKLQGPVDGGPANPRQLLVQLLSGKMPVLSGDGVNHGPAG